MIPWGKIWLFRQNSQGLYLRVDISFYNRKIRVKCNTNLGIERIWGGGCPCLGDSKLPLCLMTLPRKICHSLRCYWTWTQLLSSIEFLFKNNAYVECLYYLSRDFGMGFYILHAFYFQDSKGIKLHGYLFHSYSGSSLGFWWWVLCREWQELKKLPFPPPCSFFAFQKAVHGGSVSYHQS